MLAKEGYTGGGHWYTNMYGFGLNIDPARRGKPADILDKINTEDAKVHFAATGTLAGASLTGDFVWRNTLGPTPLSQGEEASLGISNALSVFPATDGVAIKSNFRGRRLPNAQPTSLDPRQYYSPVTNSGQAITTPNLSSPPPETTNLAPGLSVTEPSHDIPHYLADPDNIPDMNPLVTMPINGTHNAVRALENGQALQ